MKKFEITSKEEIENIICSVDVCNLAVVDGDKPYVVPMNFGYENGVFFFHSAPVGKKVEALKENPYICVSVYVNEKLYFRNKDVACSYSMIFKSVIVSGKVNFEENIQEKKRIMNIIMKKYTDKDDFDYNNPAIKNVCVFYLNPEKITAFKRGY